VNQAKFPQRHAGHPLPGQLSLALDSAGTEPALRAAYRRLAISRRLSYEQAMSFRAYEIGIRNLAEAIARRIGRRRRRRAYQR
jgi:hypothetical protein